jgi:hypothetical protein
MRGVLSLAVLCLLLTLATAPAQQASYTTYGPACGGTYGDPPTMPQLWATGLPRLGASFLVHYQGPRFNCRYYVGAAIATGLSAVAVRIPNLGSIVLGGPNCWLLTSAEVVQWLHPLSGPRANFAVPNDPALLGVRLYQQWWLFYSVECPQDPQGYLFMTNGGALTIGT